MYTLQSTQDLYTRMRAELPQHTPLAHAMLQMILQSLWTVQGPEDRESLARHRVNISERIFRVIRENSSEEEAARAINRLVCNTTTVVGAQHDARAELIRSQIAPHIIGASLLDFGCGDGRVTAQPLREGMETQLYDIADYRHESALSLPFTSDRAALTRIHDNAIVATVLHHCERPEEELRWLASHSNRVIIMESVVSRIMPFTVQAFVDWLYNRGFHMDARGEPAAIPVPGNFHTVEEWCAMILTTGFRKIAKIIDYGIDQPAAPEHHVLIVADR